MRQKELKLKKNGASYLGILSALIMLCMVLAIITPTFLTPSNLLNVSQQISTNFIIAIGMTFIILLGGIDLSVGSIVALTGLVMGVIMKTAELPVIVAIILGLLFATAIGLFTGLLITTFDLPPFIATLGMMSVVRGAAYSITGGQPIYTFPEEFLVITSRISKVPVFTIIIMLLLFIAAAYTLKHTKFGRYVYAIGGNEACARLSGINVKKIKCITYGISGFCCGVAAIVLTSRLDSAVPTNAEGAELDAIAAVVIGGTSMDGGEGTIVGTVIGALIIGIVANGLNLLNVPTGTQTAIKGAIIVLAVIIDVLRRKKKNKA